MILVKIELENFRAYHGQHEFDLTNCAKTPNRNIVAIGGLNGAGKTTLLDAIVFSLLGVGTALKFLDDVERKGDGKELIDRTYNGLLNRHAFAEGVREASVALTFAAPEGGLLSVQRTWTYDNRGRYKADNVLVANSETEISPEHYDDILKSLIPPQVAKFFFFDGEKIQAIAQDEVGDAVVEGIDMLLGFHVLKTLTSDMDELQDRYRGQTKKLRLQEDELSELRSKETKLSNEIDGLKEEKLSIEERVDKLKETNSKIVDELTALLGGQHKNPKELQSLLTHTTTTIQDLKTQIQTAVDTWIIPAMPAGLLKRLANQLSGEEARSQWEEGKKKVEPQRERLISRIFGDQAPQPSPTLQLGQTHFLCSRIRIEWDELFNPPPAGIATDVIHDYLSVEERGQVRNKCGQVLRSSAVDMKRLLRDLDSAERKARDLRLQLEQIGDGERATELIDQKAQIDKELGEAEYAYETHNRQISAITTDLRDVRQKISKKEEDLIKSGGAGDKATFVRKVKRVIQKFQEALRPKKRDDVARYLTEMYRHLARKNDVVSKIELDENTFRPHLLDRGGNQIPLHSLSAGEREIYALALLWALAKTSRRRLPVVIDTPLARLDSEHRANIVKRYLPEAGPQVIVLSTDTEIDRENFDLISDRIAASYRLEFDTANEQTIVQDGYFKFK